MIDYDQVWITSYNGRNYYFYWLRRGLYKSYDEIRKDRRDYNYISIPDIQNIEYMEEEPIRNSSSEIIEPEKFNNIYTNVDVLTIRNESEIIQIDLNQENLYKILQFAKENNIIKN